LSRRRTIPDTARKWLTTRLTNTGIAWAARIPPAFIDSLESSITHAGPVCPIISRMVAQNMRSVGVYSPQAHRDYFARAAQHLAAELHLLNSARRLNQEYPAVPPPMEQLVRQTIHLDESFELVHQARSHGKGVILMAPHIICLPLWLGRMNMEVPVTVYFRYSKNPHRQQAKYEATRPLGFEIVDERSTPESSESRGRLIEALNQNRMVVITPDLVQKEQKSKAVRFFDRDIHLPRGPAVLSLLTGAPLITMTARPEGKAFCLTMHGPYHIEVTRRSRDARLQAIYQCLQWFSDHLVNLLKQHPSLWYFWGDKRWTRVFRNDPRYVRQVHNHSAENKPATGVT